jgi:hypothetical protein
MRLDAPAPAARISQHARSDAIIDRLRFMIIALSTGS